jgi:hypothetical protein
MEAVAVGDLHTTNIAGQGALSKYVPNPNEMVFDEFQKVVDWARARHIHNVIQAGDVCEGPRMSYEAMLALSSFLRRNDDMTFHFLLGNHDMYGETPAAGHSLEILKLLSLPHVKFHTKPKTVKIDGVDVRFLPYPHEDFDPKALNVFHKEVRGAKNDAGKAFDTDTLPASKAVTLAGHLHTAQRVRNTFFMGTLYQTNFGEKLPKYFHHVRFNSVKDYDIELIKHEPKYTLHTIVLNSRDDLQTIPTKATQLVKLVIQDGANVRASDYSHLTNVVNIRNFKSREELQKVIFEDLTAGQPIQFKTLDFFNAWLDGLDIDEEARANVRELRSRILAEARS